MSNLRSSIDKFIDFIKSNNDGLIVMQVNPTMDAVASATALYFGLAKIGQNINIVCSNTPNFDLAGRDKISNSLDTGGDNLVISFPYSEGSIDKVDYNIQGSFFNLVIVPRKGNKKINPEDVSYTYTGRKSNYIITVDVPNLQSLGQIYAENQNEFQGKNIINIDRHLINGNYGSINIVDKTRSSTSEIVFAILKEFGAEIDKDMATNLYNGLISATNNFTSFSVNSQTFETASELLKMGALKKPINMSPNNSGGMNTQGMGGFGTGNFGENSNFGANNSLGTEPMRQGQNYLHRQSSNFQRQVSQPTMNQNFSTQTINRQPFNNQTNQNQNINNRSMMTNSQNNQFTQNQSTNSNSDNNIGSNIGGGFNSSNNSVKSKSNNQNNQINTKQQIRGMNNEQNSPIRKQDGSNSNKNNQKDQPNKSWLDKINDIQQKTGDADNPNEPRILEESGNSNNPAIYENRNRVRGVQPNTNTNDLRPNLNNSINL